MRWKAIVAIVLAVAAVPGCTKQCYLTEGDYHSYHDVELPANLENLARTNVVPEPGQTQAPTTVNDTRRPMRYISLREALAIALESGHVGSQTPAFPRGHAPDTLVRFEGNDVVGEDSIRVLALLPAISATRTESSLSKFDVSWNTALLWTRSDEPTGEPLPLLQPGIAPPSVIQGITPPGNFVLPTNQNLAGDVLHSDTVHFSTGLVKPLPTGGVAGITFATDYERTDPTTGRVNPAYRPSVQFAFEQPLLQAFGVEINELLDQHPGGLLLPVPRVSSSEGILISRVRTDELRAELERNINYMLLNVEIAYWNLYGSYYQLYSREEGMRVAFELWRLSKAWLDLKAITQADYDAARRQYERFRGERLASLGDVLESERQLRGLLGLPTEDGTRLVPSDAPTVAPFQPDWATSLDEALNLRPELLLCRQDLKVRQLDVIREKNKLLPDLRFLASYNVHSLGGQIDGGDVPENAFHELVHDPFGTSSLGLVMNVPIGFRDAHAGVRAAELNLARSYDVLRGEESKAERYLALQYRRVLEANQQIEAQRAVREAAAEELQLRIKQIGVLGDQTTQTVHIKALTDAQRAWADGITSEYNAIVEYNNALITFQFATGTIMRYDQVLIADGPLPHCAQVRAVEHERELTQGKVLQEQARAMCQPEGCPKDALCGLNLPPLPSGAAMPLPALLPGTPPRPATLPAPGPATAATPTALPTPRPAPPGTYGPPLTALNGK